MNNARKVVVKHRNGGESEFDPKVLQSLLNTLSREMKTEHLDLDGAIGKVSSSLPDTVTTEDLTKLVAETLASMTTRHYQYSELASKVLSAHLQKGLPKSFSENFARIFNYKFGVSDSADSMVLSPRVYKTVQANSTKIDEQIAHDRDYDIDYFGLRTLMCSYLIRLEGVLAETPQFMFMRVALGIHYDNIEKALQTYELMSKKYFIHASPTLFNSGLEASNLSSCFLLSMKDDSIDGIFKTLYDTAMISKSAGGIGINISNIRSRGSYIKGTSGISSGLVPLLKVFNSTANYVDQGGNKRPGAFCMYLEPWHGDVFEFLDLRKNHGKEEMRARDLFLALWIPDLFMEKVEKDLDWYLFSPDKCPGLNECYGNKFNDLYERYIEKNMFIRKVRARELWHAILVSQTETGNPFLLYKDRCNVLSNQKNLGVIKGSNLCCEIIEYSSKDETAVCNLASVALPTFVGNGTFNFQKLHEIAKIVIENLDKVIDINQYPLENCKQSNMKHRPVGLGIQGLADVFFKLRFPFDSTESKKINIKIFETIYHAALEASCELAKKYGKYESYEGSPVSRGLLQFDLCKVQPSNLWDWDLLREKIKKYGVRNSLLVALMPTATTSQILGFNECFEPITSNIYIRRVLSGEYQVVNKYLVDDLDKLGLWNIEIKNKIIEHNGSVQNIAEVPDGLKDLYKTVWELSQKTIIDLAADRGPFVDQSQSMNLFLDNVTFSKLTSMHFYAWKKGLKTGMYYLRTKAAASAIQFSLDPSSLQVTNVKKGAGKRVRILKDGESEIENSPHKVVKANATNDEYDIFNTTIVSCNLRDPDGCESCSA